MSDKQLFDTEETAIAVPASEAQNALMAAQASEPRTLLEVIARAVSDPRMDVEKMERLLAMHERISDQQRTAEFMSAMSRLQSKLPHINKQGRIIVKGTERSRYARIEDIDRAIRPLLAEEGFAFSFDSDSSDGKIFKLSCKLSHRDGHSETKYLVLPLDKSDYRSDVQSIGSTVSYGKRQLIKMHLNLIEEGEDDGGQGGAEPITENQTRDLLALMGEVKADVPRFLKFMGVDKISAILSRDYQKACNALEAKRRGNAVD